MAFLNRGLEIVLRDERPAAAEEKEHDEVEETTLSEVVYKYDGGLVDYVDFLGAHKDAVHRTVVSFEAESEYIDGGLSLDVAMQWNTGFTESVHTFANTINTHEGGTHEEGFRAALTTLVNKFARDWNILKEKDANLTGDDVREGLTAIVSVKLAEPQFEGQTKTKLGNTEAKSFVQKVVNDKARRVVREEPDRGQGDRAQGAGPRPWPGWPPARRATPPAAARVCSVAAACRASWPTASRPTPRSASSSSSRATPPAVRPSRAATSGPRRSCRSAARS
jgi:DNA gyrase subunit B